MRETIKRADVEPGKCHANGYGEVAQAIEQRMAGMPKAVWDANAGRMVPVAYDVEIVPLVSDEQYRQREHDASRVMELRNAARRGAFVMRNMDRDRQAATASYNRLVNAMQSDDGIGTSFMTRSERALASEEWGKRLHDLIEAGKRRKAEREYNRVVCDPQWDE